MQHPHLEVLHRWFDAFERGDLDAARDVLAVGAVLHVTQPRELAGAYMGFDEFLDFYNRKRASAGEGFTYRVDEMLAGDHSAAAVLTLSSGGGGERREWKQVAVYRIVDAMIVEMWFIEEDPLPSDA